MLPAMRLVDLHTHTTASDGTCTPTALVEVAMQTALAAVAVTDNDTLAGVPEAEQAARKLGMELVPGVEVSAEHSPGSMHIVGLLLDWRHGGLNDWLTELSAGRARRNPRIISRLQGLGVDIEMAEAEAQAFGGQVGRPHIAQVLVSKGVVGSVEEAFNRYLAKHAPAYAERPRATPREAIAHIHAAGGLAILAHPETCRARGAAELEALLRSLMAVGLDGVEVHTSGSSPEQRVLTARLCARLGLLPSGGSDYHGDVRPSVRLGKGRGNLRVPYALLQRLKAARAQLHRRTSLAMLRDERLPSRPLASRSGERSP